MELYTNQTEPSPFPALFSCLDSDQRSRKMRSWNGVDGVREVGRIYDDSVFTDKVGAEAERVDDTLWNFGERAAVVRVTKQDLV